MSTELQRRKEAVQLYYYHHVSKATICRRLACSRSWLDRWLNRYDPDDVENSLHDRPPGPHSPSSRWPKEIREQVLEMRRARSDRTQHPFSLTGAAAIHHELQALHGANVPPIRTIHAWLVRAGLVCPGHVVRKKRQGTPFPGPVATTVNTIQQLDLKGPVYLQDSGHKYYLAVLRDRYSHRCALSALQSRQALGIVTFLVESWRWLGVPAYLQMDNAAEFRGTLPHSPRSFGRVVRVAVNIGVEPLFNPPREPWRNGGVERYNGFLEDRLGPLEFADFDALQRAAHTCQHACNTTHRSTGLQGATPHEVARRATLRLLSPNYQRHLQTLPQVGGFVTFLRFVRKSGRITLGPGDRFMVDPALAHTYVVARVDLARARVMISQHLNRKLVRDYDYSKETIGQWAADDEKNTRTINEQNCLGNSCTSEH